jgi:NAD(P)-dependent dehydrogenase (short-subunit alcohol dehydrogenase family)
LLGSLTRNLSTVVITGVSPGSLGADTARSILAHKPAQLILASQTEAKLLEVAKSLDIPEDTAVRSVVLDLASLKSVQLAASTILSHVVSIDALICTAGVMAVSTYTKSKDGIELQFAINHLGHFQLVNLLLEKLVAGNAAVVTYTSEAYQRADPNFLDDVTYEQRNKYDKWTAYSNSKLCNILHAIGLKQHYGKQGLRSFSVDPGIIVTTALTRSVPYEDFRAMGKIPCAHALSCLPLVYSNFK